jgi:hypothetical protein
VLVAQAEAAAGWGRALAAAPRLLPDLGEDVGEDPLVALLVPTGLDTRQQPIDTLLT